MNKNIKKTLSAINANGQYLWLRITTVFLLSIPLLFFFLGSWGLFDPDGGRYSSIPREMFLSGNFITPMENHMKFFDKPPLLYWTIAGSYGIFGIHDWAARLVPALAALLGVFVAYWLGQRMFGKRSGFLSAIILLTSAEWLILGRVVITDMLLSALIFTALAFWWMGYSSREDESSNGLIYDIGFTIALALAVLTKGPVAVVLCGGTIFFYVLICKKWHAIRKMHWHLILPLFAVIAVPWYWLVAVHNPSFNHYFWYDQNIARFLGHTTGNNHIESPFYYLKFLPLMFFPWSFFIPAALFHGWKNRRGVSPKHCAMIYLLCGACWILLFFSASRGKILTYILAVMPLLSIMLSFYIDRLYKLHVPDIKNMWKRPLTVWAMILSAFLMLGGIAVILYAPQELSEFSVSGVAGLWFGAILIAWSLVLIFASWKYRLNGIISTTVVGFATAFMCVLVIITKITPQIVTKPVINYIRPGLQSNTRIVTYDGYRQSVGFYTGKRVYIIKPPSELTIGIKNLSSSEKKQWIYDGQKPAIALKHILELSVPVYCFMKNKKKKVNPLMQKLGEVAVKIVANKKHVVIGNIAASKLTPPKQVGWS